MSYYTKPIPTALEISYKDIEDKKDRKIKELYAKADAANAYSYIYGDEGTTFIVYEAWVYEEEDAIIKEYSDAFYERVISPVRPLLDALEAKFWASVEASEKARKEWENNREEREAEEKKKLEEEKKEEEERKKKAEERQRELEAQAERVRKKQQDMNKRISDKLDKSSEIRSSIDKMFDELEDGIKIGSVNDIKSIATRILAAAS